MTTLRLLPGSTCPPDKFRYIHAEDGHANTAFDRDSWFAAILRHKQNNGYEIPDDWQARAEDQLCRVLPPGWCEYAHGGEPSEFLDRRTPLQDIVNGTKVLAAFVASGCELVPQAEAETRGAICAGCYAREAVQGCAPCVGLSNLVAEICGARETRADAILEGKACLVCHCAARANVWIPVEVSKEGVTPEMMRQFPDFCWKRQQIEALTEAASQSPAGAPKSRAARAGRPIAPPE